MLQRGVASAPAPPIVLTGLLEATAATTATAGEGFLSGFASGAVSRVNKELLLHPIDMVLARLQTSAAVCAASNASFTGDGLYRGLYDGIVPAVVGGVPVGALFFGAKDASKRTFRAAGLSWLAVTMLSVAVTNVPYWVILSPVEVLKMRRLDMSAGQSLRAMYSGGGT